MFITKTKERPNNQTILDKVQKVVDGSFWRKFHIEEQIVIIKNVLVMTRKLFYVILASWGAARTSPIPLTNILFPYFYSKAYKIIIKVNDKSAAQVLDSQSPKNIMESIHQCVKTKNIMDTDIWATWKLKSGNIAVYIANNNKTKKLLENDCWIEVLGKKAKPITKTLRIVAHAVRVDLIDLAHKKITIEKIHAKNTTLILGLKIKWIGWLINFSSEKNESLLVIEYKTAIQANQSIDKSLTIGAELPQYILYNAACKQK